MSAISFINIYIYIYQPCTSACSFYSPVHVSDKHFRLLCDDVLLQYNNNKLGEKNSKSSIWNNFFSFFILSTNLGLCRTMHEKCQSTTSTLIQSYKEFNNLYLSFLCAIKRETWNNRGKKILHHTKEWRYKKKEW